MKPTKKKSERGWSYGTSPWQVSVSAESFQPRETDDCRQTGDGAEGGRGGAEGEGREGWWFGMRLNSCNTRVEFSDGFLAVMCRLLKGAKGLRSEEHS